MRRKSLRVPSAPLADYIKEQGITAAQMDDILGYKTSVSHWLRCGEMPPVILLALEGLKRRRRQDETRDTIVLARVPPAKRGPVKAFLEALAIETVELP